MLVEDWALSKIKPYPNNPRVLRNAAEKVAESIKAFGWRQPIVVDEDGVIIIGHSRLAAAQLLKLKKVPVHVATGLTADQVRALRVADNKTGTFADWDQGKLADELQAIMAGLGSVTVTGFSQAEFDALEMQAKAALAEIKLPGQPAPAPDPEDDDFDLGGDESDTSGADLDMPGADPQASGSGSDDAGEPRRDMVPFNVLMDVDHRQVVYDAIAKAKQANGLETTADALLVIARSYLDA